MPQKRLKCPSVNCTAVFSRQFNLNRHFERYHLNQDVIEKCLLCGLLFESCKDLQKHYAQYHKPSKKFYEKTSAFRKQLIVFRYNFSQTDTDFKNAQQNIFSDIRETILAEAAKKTVIKVNLIYICNMSMLDHVGDKLTTTFIPFRAPAFIANARSKSSISKNITSSFSIQENEMEEFCNCGSNWVFEHAAAFDIEIAALRPILTGQDFVTGQDYVKLNKQICDENKVNLKNFKNSKSLFNPKNNDYKCFLYCVKFFIQNQENEKTFFDSLHLKGISFPISISHIKKFLEQNNHLNLKINILYQNLNKEIFPLEFGLGNGENILTLLMIERCERKNSSYNHFLVIKDVNKFLRLQYKNEKKQSYKKSVFCLNCLNPFSSVEVLKKHSNVCCHNKPRKELTPDDNQTIISFKNFKNTHPVEFISFLDFECVLNPNQTLCQECSHTRCKCDRSFTEIVNYQKPIAYSFVILDSNSVIIHEHTYSGENAAENFVNHLLEQETKWIKNLITQEIQMRMSLKEELFFKAEGKCYMCEKEFSNNVVKCRDHCHFTGKFLGAACQCCNLERKKPKDLKIFMHNGSRYDFHFIVKALNGRTDVKNIRVLPYNGENFRTISFNTFTFLDSLSFLQSSLGQLAADLSNTDNEYNVLKQTYLVKTKGIFDRKKYKMVLGKSYFPYEYW
jgi:Recombination endonuclease VII